MVLCMEEEKYHHCIYQNIPLYLVSPHFLIRLTVYISYWCKLLVLSDEEKHFTDFHWHTISKYKALLYFKILKYDINGCRSEMHEIGIFFSSRTFTF